MRTRVFAALIAAFVLPLVGQAVSARPLHHHRTHVRVVRSSIIRCDLRGCHRSGPRVAEHYAVRSGGCPHYLGCGCNLANRLGGVARFGRRLWRDLWVARNWAREGHAARHGCIGCVVVLSRGRGGHVGIVKGYDANGNPIAYSYANAQLGWTTTSYSARRVIAYRAL